MKKSKNRIDAVKMMREIRYKLQKYYENNPEQRKIDMKYIHQKIYETKCFC